VTKDFESILFRARTLWTDPLIATFYFAGRPCNVYRKVINHTKGTQPHRIPFVTEPSTAAVTRHVAADADLLCDKATAFQDLIKYTLWYNKQHRQCTYNLNIEACPHNHCCRGKAISVTYSECVFVALGTHYVMRMRHIIICGFSVSTVFFHVFP
jgi:hypothetical protein